VSRIAQERPPLGPSAQRLGHERHTAPLGDQAADVQAPGRIESIYYPVIALLRWQLVDDVGQRGGTIGAGPRLPPFQITCPVATTNEAIKARTPWRMYACSRCSGFPGAMGCVGYVRCSICIPVFSSGQITTRSWSQKRRAWRDKAHISWALASQAGAWLLSQETLRWGLRSASSRRRQMLARLLVPSRPCLRAGTRSSRLQRVAGQ
jgi:hypothetical protein